jgi:hypothetical protein
VIGRQLGTTPASRSRAIVSASAWKTASTLIPCGVLVDALPLGHAAQELVEPELAVFVDGRGPGAQLRREVGNGRHSTKASLPSQYGFGCRAETHHRSSP